MLSEPDTKRFAEAISDRNRSTYPIPNGVWCVEAQEQAPRSFHTERFGSVGQDKISDIATRRSSLNADDRKVFDLWAMWVAAFYSLIALVLLGMLMAGARGSEERSELSAHTENTALHGRK